MGSRTLPPGCSVRGLSPRRARLPRASSLQRGPAARVGLRPAGGSPRKHLPRGMTHHSCLCVRRCEALARGWAPSWDRRPAGRVPVTGWAAGRWPGRLSGRGGCCPQRSWAPPGAAALPGDQGGDAGSALAEPSAHIPHRQLRGVAAGAPIPGSGLCPRRLRPRSGAGSPGPAGKVTPQSFTAHVTRPLAR